MFLAIVSSAGAAFVFKNQIDQQIDDSLAREASELGLLAQDYVSVEQLLREYVQRSSPSEGEQLLAIVNTEVVIRSGISGLRLDLDEQFIGLVSSVTSTTLGDFENESGTFRWIAVPVRGDASGVFVATFDTNESQQQFGVALFSFATLALIAIIAAGLIGWYSSGRIFRPISRISKSISSIDSKELTTRIAVGTSGNELDALANEFNLLLDRLQEAFENQKQFVDDAGHELRTPLTVIRGHLDLVESDPESNAASLEIVKDELARMSRLVLDLQTLTKSNQPGFVELEKTELAELNDELFVKAEALANRNWIPSRKQCTGAEVIDRQRITQAVLQLADNACKQTSEEDHIEVGVDCGEDYVAFYVADSGPGIPVDQREHITKRFARGSQHYEKGEGSGLGLAVVEAIAQAHNGYLRIDSSELGGAWVGIVLPRGDR